MSAPRLHLDQPIAAGARVALDQRQAHYLRNVMRLRPGSEVLVFNGRDGEWLARLGEGKEPSLVAAERRRSQPPEAGPTLLAAPIKRPRLEWLLEKAVELGVRRIVPVLTERSVVRPDASHRLRARAIEAAEQCGRLDVPEIAEPLPLAAAVDMVTAAETMAFADEAGGGRPLVEALEAERLAAFLIGPEGGFAPREREMLLGRDRVVPVSLVVFINVSETSEIYTVACWRAVADRRGCGAAGDSSSTIRRESTGGDSR